jgi:hypothetical protein
MSAKTDFQSKYVKSAGQLGQTSGVAELAGDLWDAMNGKIEVVTANRTLTALDSGTTFVCATSAVVYTLPSTAANLKFTFIVLGARTAVINTISPAAADGISGTFTLAASVVVDAGVVNKDIVNTAATHEPGDWVTLLGTGTAGTAAWVILGSGGIWAVEG